MNRRELLQRALVLMGGLVAQKALPAPKMQDITPVASINATFDLRTVEGAKAFAARAAIPGYTFHRCTIIGEARRGIDISGKNLAFIECAWEFWP